MKILLYARIFLILYFDSFLKSFTLIVLQMSGNLYLINQVRFNLLPLTPRLKIVLMFYIFGQQMCQEIY